MFSKLLVPLDRSALAEQAIGRTAAIARRSHASIDVILVHEPIPLGGFGDAPWNAEQLPDEERYVEAIAEELRDGASVPTTYAVLPGGAVEEICARARDVGVDLIVMTSHGRTGLSRAWMGSVADGVLRHASIPVLILPAAEGPADRAATHDLFKHILVTLDGSSLAMEIVAPAVALARSNDAHVTLLRVVEPVLTAVIDAGMPIELGLPPSYPPMYADARATQQLVDEAKQQLAGVSRTFGEQGVSSVETHVVVAWNVAHAILGYARGQGVDAIAMSTHGRGVSRLLVGSVADKVLRASGVAAMLQRPRSRDDRNDATNH